MGAPLCHVPDGKRTLLGRQSQSEKGDILMKQIIPNFSEKEWAMMEEYRKNAAKQPRENLIELISHVDPKIAEQGVNSGPYFMLDRLLSDEQIDFANHLKLRTPTYITELAQKSGKSVEEAARLADELCRIGLLFYKPDARGVDRVELPIFVVGVLEQLLLGGLTCDQYENYPELAVGFVYHTTQMCTGNGAFLPVANHGVHRPVPVATALKNETHVESWENLEKLIEESADGSYAICECICRKIRKQYDELGDEPDLHWCMPLGNYAESAIRTGKAKRVTKEEYLARLKEAEDRGYVHNVSNHDGPSPIEYICNCDYQTCMSIRASNYTQSANLSKSNFVAKVDEEKCVACGSCVEKCPANAVKLGQKLPQKKPVAYQDCDLPNEINALSWGPERWNPDYLLNRKNVQPETGTAPCKTNCPAHIAVQGYLRMAAQGRFADALELIKKENPLPAVCGNICNRRCEQVCTRGDVDEAVAIDEVKKFLAYQELQAENRFVPKKIRLKGHKLAVIGGGPGGISCAYYLAVEGHQVTIFDKNEDLGGMLRYGVPSFRLEKDVLSAEIDVLRALGVTFRCGVEVGRDVTIQQLREQGYRGFFLAIGAQKSASLRIPGEALTGVFGGVDFLRAVNQGRTPDIGEKVAVVGGGNVAMDVARTAVRLGAKETYVVYRRSEHEMPADPAEVAEAMEEGVQFRFLNAPVEILGTDGRVSGLRVERMELGAPDAKGRRAPVGTGELETVAVDSVIGAIGQVVDWGGLDVGALQKTKRELAVADEFTYQTAEPDIFVGGDVLTGPKFAIDAIAAGKQAAISLHRYAWGNNLVTGRDRRDYTYIDKDNLKIERYDTAHRQKPPVDLSKKKTMRDERGVFTPEQVKIETARCLKCGAAHVDENMCIGCGVCTTRCKMDAITLRKKYNEVPVPNELLMEDVGREVMRRRDALYGGKPIQKAVATMLIKKKVAVKKNRGKAKPRAW